MLRLNNMNQDRFFPPPAREPGLSHDPAGMPSTLPLNPGEGGPLPLYGPGPETGESAGADTPSTLPLNPGEGGPLPPYGDGPWNGGNAGADTPSTLPLNPGEGGPLPPHGPGHRPGGGSSGSGGTPTVTWPDTPNRPNTGGSGTGGSGASILPGIIGAMWPSAATVRFLNAGYNYPAFRIFVGGHQAVNLLNYASATNYEKIGAGYQVVTVTGANGYVYIQKTMPFQANTVTTIAVINTASGLDLLQITDGCCPPSGGYSSFRMGNLAYNSGPMDVILSDGRVVYTDLRYKEVTAFKRIMPGTYQFFYADTNLAPMESEQDIETLDSSWLGVYIPPQEAFGSLFLNVESGAMYTVYLLQSGTERNNVQNLILMDH